jgi:hypothetical protein
MDGFPKARTGMFRFVTKAAHSVRGDEKSHLTTELE